jgi:DnaK suppressor protein
MTEHTKYQAQLQSRLTELSSEARHLEEELRTPHSADAEERAVESEGDEVLEGLEQAAVAEMQQINDALKRIELGTFGACTHCGNDIDTERLDVLPHTPVCVNCAAGG